MLALWSFVSRVSHKPGSNEFCLRSANHKPTVAGLCLASSVSCCVSIFWPRLYRWPLPPCLRAASSRVPAPASRWRVRRSRSPRFPGRHSVMSASPAIPARATVRVQISDSAEAADFTVIDDIDNAEAGSCAAGTAAELVAISTRPSAQDPVIYLSVNGPADYRIFVQSKSFSATRRRRLDRRRPWHPPSARSGVALTFHSPCSKRGTQPAWRSQTLCKCRQRIVGISAGRPNRFNSDRQSQGQCRWVERSGSNCTFVALAVVIPGSPSPSAPS